MKDMVSLSSCFGGRCRSAYPAPFAPPPYSVAPERNGSGDVQLKTHRLWPHRLAHAQPPSGDAALQGCVLTHQRRHTSIRPDTGHSCTWPKWTPTAAARSRTSPHRASTIPATPNMVADVGIDGEVEPQANRGEQPAGGSSGNARATTAIAPCSAPICGSPDSTSKPRTGSWPSAKKMRSR